MARSRSGGELLQYVRDRSSAFVSYHGEWRQARAADDGDRPLTVRLRAAAARYGPVPYDGPVLLVRTRGLRLDVPRMGWGDVLRGQVEEAEVPFHPHGALAEASVGHTAEVLSRYVQRLAAAMRPLR
jgi:hypothetical protein